MKIMVSFLMRFLRFVFGVKSENSSVNPPSDFSTSETTLYNDYRVVYATAWGEPEVKIVRGVVTLTWNQTSITIDTDAVTCNQSGYGDIQVFDPQGDLIYKQSSRSQKASQVSVGGRGNTQIIH